MILKKLKNNILDGIVAVITVSGFIMLKGYIEFWDQQEKLKKWHREMKERNNDSRTDLFRE